MWQNYFGNVMRGCVKDNQNVPIILWYRIKFSDSHSGSFSLKVRGATPTKAPKAWALSKFCRIEGGGGSGGTPLMWPPLWGPCLPKFGRGAPEQGMFNSSSC